MDIVFLLFPLYLYVRTKIKKKIGNKYAWFISCIFTNGRMNLKKTRRTKLNNNRSNKLSIHSVLIGTLVRKKNNKKQHISRKKKSVTAKNAEKKEEEKSVRLALAFIFFLFLVAILRCFQLNSPVSWFQYQKLVLRILYSCHGMAYRLYGFDRQIISLKAKFTTYLYVTIYLPYRFRLFINNNTMYRNNSKL